MNTPVNRRQFLRDASILATGSMLLNASNPDASAAFAGRESNPNALVVDPEPLFAISPRFYMQFMEPLGVTDASVEAAWDYDRDDWRADLVKTVSDLSPDTIRWGGNFIRYYKWREGVGPLQDRPPMFNYDWGGKETNRIGTHELVDLCRRVGAEPLICVNFMSDGVRRHWKTVHGENRCGDAEEAADWVSYANDPDNRERKKHGILQPYNIRWWQIGNETSYASDGFQLDQAADHTLTFAKAMKKKDPSITLIGWGDDRGHDGRFWAGEMLKRAGEYLDCVALHMMGMRPRRKNTVLAGDAYQREPEQAWEELLELTQTVESRIQRMKAIIESQHSSACIAVTEGHLSINPHNSNPILQEWLSSVYHARSMNIYQRHGDRVSICTGADFCGTRWTVNAVKVQVPRGISYLMPVASIMRLFKKHNGKHGIGTLSCPADLDVAASRSDTAVYLHVVNLNYRKPVQTTFAVRGKEIAGVRVFEIAPENPRQSVDQDRPDVFAPKEKVLPPGRTWTWNFPAASVSAVELQLKA